MIRLLIGSSTSHAASEPLVPETNRNLFAMGKPDPLGVTRDRAAVVLLNRKSADSPLTIAVRSSDPSSAVSIAEKDWIPALEGSIVRR